MSAIQWIGNTSGAKSAKEITEGNGNENEITEETESGKETATGAGSDHRDGHDRLRLALIAIGKATEEIMSEIEGSATVREAADVMMIATGDVKPLWSYPLTRKTLLIRFF